MAEQLDIEGLFKLKVDELKQELGKRSLSKSGSKSELQERLLQYVTMHDGSAIIQNFEVEPIDSIDEETKEELDDILKKPEEPNYKKLSIDSDSVDRFIDSIPNSDSEDIIGNGTGNADDVVNVSVDKSDDTIVSKIDEDELSAQNSDGKLCKITGKTNSSSDDATNRQKITCMKSTVLISTEEKRNSRSKRFGASSESEKKKARLDRFSISSKDTEIDEDKIKKRKERFGVVSSILVKSEDIDRLKKRQERFADETIKKRQERFGVMQKVTVELTSPGAELRKQKRLLKFAAD